MIRLWSSPVAALAALGVAMVPTAAPDRTPPRIVSAVMVDLNGNARAERVRLDIFRAGSSRAGQRREVLICRCRLPGAGRGGGHEAVAGAPGQGKGERRFGGSAGSAVQEDELEAGAGRGGNQASAQVFRSTRAHGHVPPVQPKPAPRSRPLLRHLRLLRLPGRRTPTADGFDDAHDCAPKDASIHAGAPDVTRPRLRRRELRRDRRRRATRRLRLAEREGHEPGHEGGSRSGRSRRR